MNDLIRVLLDALDEFTTGDPTDDRVVHDRLELAQEVAQVLWEQGYRVQAKGAERKATNPYYDHEDAPPWLREQAKGAE